MKYLLRNTVTGRYLKQPGIWVRSIDDAMVFDDSTEAREFCQAHQLNETRPVQRPNPYLMSLASASQMSRA